MSASITQHLLDAGTVSSRDIDQVQRLQSESGDSFPVLLVRLGLISDAELCQRYSELLGIPVVKSQDLSICALKVDRVSRQFLRQSRVVPYERVDGQIALAMSDPEDEFALKAISFFIKGPVHRLVATTRDIETALDCLYPSTQEVSTADAVIAGEHEEDNIDRLRDLASEAPVIRLVQHLIAQAIERKASDIHFEPMVDRLSVRFRIDGLLEEVETLPDTLRAAVVSRVKILAQLNIAERRLPQDGRIQLTINGRKTDFRVATSPTLHGESVVLRILDQRDVVLDFVALGFQEDDRQRFEKSLKQPHGIILVTGPTGSGKTTSLYAALKQLNSPERKILTAEDPIEYTLERVNQTQVKPQIGHDFANALRSFLRQDPDVIMVGEIRDLETARIAIQASLTGHLLLSTLHTNSAAGAVSRLLDMGVEDYLLASTLNVVLGQRLVRRLCEKCRQAYPAPESALIDFGVKPKEVSGLPVFYRPGQCSVCARTGYAGRIAIVEVLPIDEAIQQLIVRRSSSAEIEKAAIGRGFRTMRQDGLEKCLAGQTSWEEVLRVTQNI